MRYRRPRRPMTTDAIAYPPFGRIVAALLTAISRGSLLVLVALLLFFDTRLGNPLRLMRVFASLCLVPGLAAWLLARAHAVTATVRSGTLVLARRGRRVEVPCDAIDHVAPWTVPLPGDGVSLGLRSGRRFRWGLQIARPVTLIGALADAGAPERVRDASQRPAAIYAEAKRGPAHWYHGALKFVVFALVPTLPLFRLHQWIAYGGTFGEYYTYGLRAYLLAFGIYWASFTIHLVLYAATLRAAAEVVALAAAHLAPGRAGRVRRVVEVTAGLLYYGGVPLFLVRLFLAS